MQRVDFTRNASPPAISSRVVVLPLPPPPPSYAKENIFRVSRVVRARARARARARKSAKLRRSINRDRNFRRRRRKRVRVFPLYSFDDKFGAGRDKSGERAPEFSPEARRIFRGIRVERAIT